MTKARRGNPGQMSARMTPHGTKALPGTAHARDFRQAAGMASNIPPQHRRRQEVKSSQAHLFSAHKSCFSLLKHDTRCVNSVLDFRLNSCSRRGPDGPVQLKALQGPTSDRGRDNWIFVHVFHRKYNETHKSLIHNASFHFFSSARRWKIMLSSPQFIPNPILQ